MFRTGKIYEDCGPKYLDEWKLYNDSQTGKLLIPEDLTHMLFVNYILHPESKGYITLKDSNPLSHPIIQPNYFQVERDRDVMVEGYKIIQNIMSQEPIK